MTDKDWKQWAHKQKKLEQNPDSFNLATQAQALAAAELREPKETVIYQGKGQVRDPDSTLLPAAKLTDFVRDLERNNATSD